MKIIQAMKQIKANKEKIRDLSAGIARYSAYLSIETPGYPEQTAKVREWTQTCLDVSRDNIELLVRIAKTNMATQVTIEIGGKSVTKSIAEWVWRRREYAALDLAIWQQQSDRNLKEQNVATSQGTITEIRLVRCYDPEVRDKAMAILREEPHLIDSTLEVINATTDLLE